MKPKPNQTIPQGCAVVAPDCSLGDAERAFRQSLARHVGHIVKVPEIKRWTPPRSNQQNRTVRGFWMPIILEELGYRPHDAEYLYQSIKVKIGWVDEVVNKITGEVKKMPRPTADCDTATYAEFMERFRAFVEDADSGLGILLPNPDPMMARI